MDFTYNAYVDLINGLREHGYSIADYHNCDSVFHPCILRHDIDNSLEKAAKFAKLEKKMAIKATYFVLITSDFYNVFSDKSRKLLHQIIDCGHEIGLHFDETAYDQTMLRGGIAKQILYEKKLLESVCQKEVSVVSMHRPSKGLLESDLKVPGMINSYSQKFFKEFKYVSDSRMRWREDVMKYVNERTYDRLHILTHAFWYEDTSHSIGESLSSFVQAAGAERYENLMHNFTNLEDILEQDGSLVVQGEEA